jgi:hypothetical protein
LLDDHDNSVDPPALSVLGVAVNAVIVAAGAAWLTVTVNEAGRPIPPGPVHSSVYTYTPAALSGPTVKALLETATLPLQPSEPLPPPAVHALAPLVVQENEVDCPTNNVFGEAIKEVTLGSGGNTLTTTGATAGRLVPPAPVQVSM